MLCTHWLSTLPAGRKLPTVFNLHGRVKMEKKISLLQTDIGGGETLKNLGAALFPLSPILHCWGWQDYGVRVDQDLISHWCVSAHLVLYRPEWKGQIDSVLARCSLYLDPWFKADRCVKSYVARKLPSEDTAAYIDESKLLRLRLALIYMWQIPSRSQFLVV